MTVRLDSPVVAGSVSLPPGQYEVSVDERTRSIVLASPGKRVEVPASLRSSKVRVTAPSVQVRRVRGEARLLVIVRTPVATEWVASLDEPR